MNTTLIIKSALHSINHHKGRSLLTILGIIIGIASIIAILAIGHGAEERVRREILAAGDNYIFIHTGNWLAEAQGKTLRPKKIEPLTINDIKTLKKHIPAIKSISPLMFMRSHISYHGKSISSEIKGGSSKLYTILSRRVAYGQWFNVTHVHKRCRVIVLGAKAAQELFNKRNPIGQAIQINKYNFIVIGVLKPMESRLGTQDPNLDSFIPFSTAKKLFLQMNGDRVPAIALSTHKTADMPNTVNLIKKVLRVRRHIIAPMPDDFTIFDQASMLKAAQRSSDIFTLFLLIIAIISLVVGGIGVMNIMLVSVKERTQEIGIRMALGATQKNILMQFLLEALLLCFIGGCIGLLTGIIIPYAVSYFTGWLVIITASSIVLALIAMISVGLAFGYYPAHQAAQLNPVEALIEQ